MSNILSKADLLSVVEPAKTLALADEEQQKTALDYISSHDLPKGKDEAWLKTNLKPMLEHRYQLAESVEVTEEELQQFKIEGLDANLLVFVNGHFQPQLSEVVSPTSEFVVNSIASALIEHTDLLEGYFSTEEKNIFTALNTAFATDGVFLYVPKGKVVEKPVHILHLSKNEDAALIQTRNVFVAEENAQVRIIESYHSLTEGSLFTNVSTNFHVKEAANVNYNLLQLQSANAYLLNNQEVLQKSDSVFTANAITLNGALVRNTLTVQQDGKHVETDLNGLYLLDGKKHTDTHIFINHAKAECNSNQFYRGILDDTASAVFTGKVYVARDAQLTNAIQSNKNILLTDTAKVSSKPQLEIYADDVACAHGSSTGQLDKDAMFYMIQRGLSKQDARVFLLFAFVADVVNKISIEPLRVYVDGFVSKRLRGE